MSSASLPFPALDVSASATAWAHRPTTAFPGPTVVDPTTVVVLPIYGLADHGLGLPLDVEETVGADLLAAAAAVGASGTLPLLVLPPWRFALSPYGEPLGALGPDDFLRVISEVAMSVRAAGFQRLLFWSTSPWNAEIIDAASRDTRVSLGLQTFVIEMAGLGLDLHPTSSSRSQVQALAAAVLGCRSESLAPPPLDNDVARDAGFRPGRWLQSPPVRPEPGLAASSIRATAVRRLVQLLREVAARPPLGDSARGNEPHPTAGGEPTVPASGAPYPPGRRSRYLPALSARALKALSNKADALVIIPVGAIEQHGPHLPVAVDAMIAEAACRGLADRLTATDPVWFAPAITVGKSNEHADYPGTLTLSAQSLRAILLTLVSNLYHLGFRQFAALNTHGGNSAVLTYTLREIQTRFGVRAGMLKIPSTSELSAQESTWGFHAGEWETSVMLALAPGLVGMEHALCHYPAHLSDPGELRPENAPAIFSWMTRDIAPAGVMGDAPAATAAKGERWFNVALDQLADQIRGLLADTAR